jgi:carboxypeptidase C (cathepsin A)
VKHASATVFLALLTLAIHAPAPALEDVAKEGEKPKVDEIDRDHVKREGSIRLGDRDVAYTSLAGTLPLRSEEGKERARMFFTAYLEGAARPPHERPLTFVFNGGPGSSSVWLHLGAFGPYVVDLDEQGFAKRPPGGLVPNDGCLLDVTDLVFVDPPTTGYSRAAAGENAAQFHGLDEDVEAVSEFVRLFTTHFQRWASPKFLAGESYGTTRAAALARHLQDRHGMYLNGVVLLSTILDFRTSDAEPGNDLGYLLMYPTAAATAFHHGRIAGPLASDLDALLAAVETKCLGEWLLAFAKGDALDDATRRAVAADIGNHLGLDPAFVLACNLRISLARFQAELLRDERRTVGRLDSRFKGIDRDAAGDSAEYDASYANILGPYSAALNDYVRRTLGYRSDLPYEILTSRVQPWNWGGGRNRNVNVATRLRDAMTKNPHLHVFNAEGLFDFATPYFAARYTLDHLGLDPEQRSRLHAATYRAGHMMYIDAASRIALKRDLAAFYAAALRD